MGIKPLSIISFKTFQSERKEWKRFCCVLLLNILLPSFVVFCFLEWVAWDIGETKSPAALALEQEHNHDLVWLGANERKSARFKLARVEEERPEILIMGQSRLAQMRSAMFKPYTCYNLTRIAWPFSEYTNLLHHLPEGYNPRVIIFSISYDQFSLDYTQTQALSAPVFDASPWREHFVSVADVASQLLWHPQLIWKRHFGNLRQPARGVAAILSGDGFRFDGAEQTPATLDKLARKDEVSQALDPVLLGRHMPAGKPFDEKEMTALREFTSEAQRRGIALVGVHMPIYTPVVQTFEKNPSQVLLHEYDARVARGDFDHLGIIFFNYLTFPGYGDKFAYYGEAFHPGETLSLAVLLAMAGDPRFHAILPKLDVAGLQSRLNEQNQWPQHLQLFENGD